MRVYQCLQNPMQHAVKVLEHLIIPKPQHLVAMLSEKLGPFLIRLSLDRVLAAIEFHHQTTFRTAEISNKLPDRMLSPEFHTDQSSVTQSGPELPFRVGLIMT